MADETGPRRSPRLAKKQDMNRSPSAPPAVTDEMEPSTSAAGIPMRPSTPKSPGPHDTERGRSALRSSSKSGKKTRASSKSSNHADSAPYAGPSGSGVPLPGALSQLLSMALQTGAPAPTGLGSVAGPSLAASGPTNDVVQQALASSKLDLAVLLKAVLDISGIGQQLSVEDIRRMQEQMVDRANTAQSQGECPVISLPTILGSPNGALTLTPETLASTCKHVKSNMLEKHLSLENGKDWFPLLSKIIRTCNSARRPHADVIAIILEFVPPGMAQASREHDIKRCGLQGD